MIIVPGNTGSTVPIKPTANRITATDHQKSSILGVEGLQR